MSMLGKCRVVITGIGAVTPIGIGVDGLWSGVMANLYVSRKNRKHIAHLFCYNHPMFPIPKRHTGPELLDLPHDAHSSGELAGNLSDIRMVNRYLGGSRTATAFISRMLDRYPQAGNNGPVTILDVASGSADIPVAIIDWARARGLGIRVTAVDINPAIVKHARERATGYPELAIEVADAFALPYPPGSFDFVMCNMAAHHFPEGDVGRLVESVSSRARLGWSIGDIRRSWIAYGLIYALTRLFTRNRLTRNDAPLSVLRAYTPEEFYAIARQAGMDDAVVVKQLFWRMSLTGS